MTTTKKPVWTGIIRRCKWCVQRTGQARVFVDGEWQAFGLVFGLIPVEELEAPGQPFKFTDGLCKECMNAEMAKLKIGVVRDADGVAHVEQETTIHDGARVHLFPKQAA